MLNKEMQALINSARTLGGKLPIRLTNDELLHICIVIAVDFGMDALVRDIDELRYLANGYYKTSPEWFKHPTSNIKFEERFMQLESAIPDFTTCFKLLCAIHKRRLKYEAILSKQAFPNMEVIAPRALLEIGLHTNEALASWLVWRKWFFDIDNRSGQETGYLFEPILAASLGGVSFSAKKSPIRRTSGTGDGRQVDCITGNLAYEFKMRVTIAASGQGRFKEELAFAEDCHRSGYIPMLLVLDPTPSSRLMELSKEYERFGGSAFVGGDAWNHLEEKAGETMGRFVEKYVRTPINDTIHSFTSLAPLQLTNNNTAIEVRLGSQSFSIIRAQLDMIDASGESQEDDDEDDI